MANVSIPKVLFGVLYFIAPLVLWFVPSVRDALPEPWLIEALIAVVWIAGLVFVNSQKKLILRILMGLLIVLSAVHAGYMEAPAVKEVFAQVDKDYETESGENYSADETAFQVKQELIAVHAVSAIPEFLRAAWISTGLLILILGAIGMREVIAYAALPKNKSKAQLSSTEDIPEDVEAVTNRPTAEQRAQALAKLKAEHPATEKKEAEPVIKLPKEETSSEASSSTDSFFQMPSDFGSNDAASDKSPIIKESVSSTMSTSATIDTSGKRNYDESPVTSTGKINIKLDLGEAPAIKVETASVYKSADGSTSVYSSEPVEEAVNEPRSEKPGKINLNASIKEEPEATYNANAVFNYFSEESSTPAPVEPVMDEVTAADNPFAAMKNPFEAMKSPFEAEAAQPAEPVIPAEPVKPVKVVLETPKPAEPVKPSVEPAKPAKPAKPAVDPAVAASREKIKEINRQVAELKTQYNEGMISQDEYIAQRTLLLQEMYSIEN